MSANTNSLMERLPCSMVECIDYGQETTLSKVRHNIPSSKIDEEFIIVALAVGVCKDIPTQPL